MNQIIESHEQPREVSAKKFDKPFFAISRGSDIDPLETYLQSNPFNDIDWALDKFSNPLCRLGVRSERRYPERVATIVCRDREMKPSVELLLARMVGQQ